MEVINTLVYFLKRNPYFANKNKKSAPPRGKISPEIANFPKCDEHSYGDQDDSNFSTIRADDLDIPELRVLEMGDDRRGP